MDKTKETTSKNHSNFEERVAGSKLPSTTPSQQQSEEVLILVRSQYDEVLRLMNHLSEQNVQILARLNDLERKQKHSTMSNSSEPETHQNKTEPERAASPPPPRPRTQIYVLETEQNQEVLDKSRAWFDSLANDVFFTREVPPEAEFVLVPFYLSTPRNVSSETILNTIQTSSGHKKIALFLQCGEIEDKSPIPNFDLKGVDALFVLYSRPLAVVESERRKNAERAIKQALEVIVDEKMGAEGKKGRTGLRASQNSQTQR